MRHDASAGRPVPLRFSVEHWAALWASPHPELAARVVTPDVVGHWPGDPEPVRGVTRYKQRLAGLLACVPDLRFELLGATLVELAQGLGLLLRVNGANDDVSLGAAAFGSGNDRLAENPVRKYDPMSKNVELAPALEIWK